LRLTLWLPQRRTCAQIFQFWRRLTNQMTIIQSVGLWRSFAFQETKLPHPDQAQHSAAGGLGRVSGMIKRSEPL